MLQLVEKIDFRRVSVPFQDALRKDIRTIKESNELIIPADKTRNQYHMSTDHYKKLLQEIITKHYKAAPGKLYDEINTEAKKIATRLKLDDRSEVLAKSEAFITLRDNKENFASALPCRLINPAKSEIGIVSKHVLEKVVSVLCDKADIRLWKNSAAVIDWFKGIGRKSDCTFVCFDIIDFYNGEPSQGCPRVRTAVRTDHQQRRGYHLPLQEISSVWERSNVD